jgi:hypothetical protein
MLIPRIFARIASTSVVDLVEVPLRELVEVQQGRLPFTLDVLGRLESRLNLLELENRQLRTELAFTQPKKRRSPGDWRFRVLSWEYVDILIHPIDHPEGKTIRALRVHVPKEDLPGGPPYWDITRKREIAVLEPVLPQIAGTNTYVHVVQEDDGPASRYLISFHPA